MQDDNENVTKLDQFVKIAEVGADYIKDNEGRAYAIINKDGYKELYALRSQSFENWLSAINYKILQEVAPYKLKSDATLHLEGVTRLEGRTHEVSLRLLGSSDFIEIDLGDSDWESVYVTKEGWQIGQHDNLFYRSKSMKPLPKPDRKNSHWTGLNQF